MMGMILIVITIASVLVVCVAAVCLFNKDLNG